MAGGRVSNQAWQEFCCVWLELVELATSVLGSQVFGPASMKSCEVQHLKLQWKLHARLYDCWRNLQGIFLVLGMLSYHMI